jgi:hypothetical protein
MDPRQTPPARVRPALLGLAAAFAVGTLGALGAAAEPERSIDATCAWGRLADGKGKLLRCLTRDEALRLRDPAPPAPPPTLLPSEAPAPAPTPAPATPPVDPAPSPEPGATHLESSLVVEVGQVVADEGALPEALKSLKKVKERYAECVDKNGGLTAERGDVELRFLVQGKGRAEGVSVKKRRGLGEAAAKCIADVVDRRYVGYPEAPAVGATVVVTVTKKKR